MKNWLLIMWTMVSCSTLDEVKKLLDGLPATEAMSAKIVVINSQRSFLGAWSDPYYVFYAKGLQNDSR